MKMEMMVKAKIESAIWGAWKSVGRPVIGMIGWIFLLNAGVFLTGCGSTVLRSESANELGNVLLKEPATVHVVVTDEARRKWYFPRSLRIVDIRILSSSNWQSMDCS